MDGELPWRSQCVWESGDLSLLGLIQRQGTTTKPHRVPSATIFSSRWVRTMDAKELIFFMVKSIVDQPDLVKINCVEGECSVVIELKVAKDDMGKVIGKDGKTVSAMRTILNATRAQKKKRHILELLE